MNLQHIKNLEKAYFVENWKRDLWFFGLSALFSFFAPALIKTAILIFVCIFTEKVLEPLLKQQRLSHYLMIPASRGEKVTSQILLYNLYFIPGLVLSSYAGWLISHFTLQRTMLLIPSDYPSMFPYLYYLYLIAASFFFGYLYFRKNAAAKILGCYILTCFLLIAIPVLVALCLNVPADKISIRFPLSKELLWIVAPIYAVFFYILSYLRYRETEA